MPLFQVPPHRAEPRPSALSRVHRFHAVVCL